MQFGLWSVQNKMNKVQQSIKFTKRINITSCVCINILHAQKIYTSRIEQKMNNSSVLHAFRCVMVIWLPLRSSDCTLETEFII